MAGRSEGQRRLFGVPAEILMLGIVSFLTDVSSEMIFSVFSIFLTVILGASGLIVGITEGLADFAASSLDFVSGYLSDKAGKRKPFALFGYGFSTAAKTILVLAVSLPGAVLFRVVERLGKSIRSPPRDALISSIASESEMGASFGVHKALDKAGAVLGPFIAYFILDRFGQTAASFRTLFLVALVPAVLAVLVLAFFVRERKPTPRARTIRKNPFALYESFGPGYKHYLRVSALFSIAYFSFAFLLLKAYLVGFRIKDVVLLYALFNVTFVISSVPIGRLGDRVGRFRIIAAEYALYAAIAAGFMLASSKAAVVAMFLLYGVFYAIDEAQSKAYISDLSPKELRASAIGVYNFATGVVYLPASLVAGALWKYAGPSYAFLFASAASLLALTVFVLGRKPVRRPS